MSTSIAENNKLRNIQNSLEQNHTLFIEKILQIEDPSINVFLKKLSDERNEECSTLQLEALRIHKVLEQTKLKVAEVKNVDLNVLKKELIAVQESTVTLKRDLQKKLDELAEQEELLQEDIKCFYDKITGWSKPMQFVSETSPKIKHFKNKYICKEVQEYSKFVETSNGPQNGWSIEDHNMFLKVRQKCKSVDHIVKILRRIFPDMSENDIMAHEEWYVQFLEFKRNQRDAIQNWRRSKTKSADPILIEDAEVVPVKKNNKNVKEKLKEWKKEKQEKAILDKQMKLNLQCETRESKMKQQLKNDDLKREVNLWKTQKTELRIAKNDERKKLEMIEKEFKASQANKLIKQYQSIDRAFIERMRNVHLKRNEDKPKRSRSIVASRDPSRLLKPTQQWIYRTRSDGNLKKIESCDIRAVNKLGVPEWRKNIQA